MFKSIEELKKPILHCGSCQTAIFKIPPGTKATERIVDTIFKSEPISPQPPPLKHAVAKCATCGKHWSVLTADCFVLKDVEG